MEMVKVSVITPVYNVEEYLEETLDSLVNQTLAPIEIIMIDDGSTDRSPDIIKEYSRRYPNIISVKQENSGPGAARNNGLKIARGEYISFVDSDDILPRDALESMYTAALSKKSAIVLGASLSFNKTETWFIGSHYNNKVYEKGEKNLIANQELLYSLGPCNKLYRRDIVKDITFPLGIKVTEDQPFVIEAYLRAGGDIYTIDKVIYNYRSRENEDNLSLSQTVRVNSVSVLKDIMKSMSISDSLWDKYIDNEVARFQVKRYYYNRLVTADIWPALRNAVDSRNRDITVQTFGIFNEWIRGLDKHFFNEIHSLHTVIFKNLVNRFDLLDSSGRKSYQECLDIALKKISFKTEIRLLESPAFESTFKAARKSGEKNSFLPIQMYVYKRKYIRFNSKVNTAVIRRIVFPLCKLLPLQDKITFASSKVASLQDSFECLYDEIEKSRPDYKVVGHFKKERSFKDYVKLYYDIATSKYVIVEDYYRPLYKLKARKGTEVIQTWHAAGAFKKFGHSAVGYRESNTKEFENQAHGSYTKVAVTSKEIIPHYAEAFNISEKNVYSVGLPRTDVFFDQEGIEYLRKKYEAVYPAMRNKKIITYAPTFRGGPGKRSSFNIQLDLKKMAEELSDEYVLILKLHPSVTKGVNIPKEAKDFVLNLSKNDINNVLSITDILISDYSSVIFEYALLERPMIFYAYDLEEYLQDRGFYYEYKDFIPGPLADKTEQVISLIQQNAFDIQKVKAFKERFFEVFDGQASKRFVETLIKPIKKS
ncbi:glycosyltransferase [Pradoshia sp. D12]|uniref:bifunctional glycosyltransferase/CDP-glycerol:glycerophosphate glycerophosphotransferase n=1 Tax=Bacillaceae TaxID=186817 RepID=UPI00112972C2|nr:MULTISPECIES: CDP-glycerol glycerophosphotransferase family protein [Bacillaceae]QFK72893.1 glycosyltransferase [Pradoshia sp. D12]TPF71885.1 glycosyltransferase [Bacillus sp. D12]